MKTLNEVIKIMNICDETQTSDCIGCPYAVDCKDVPGKKLRADALYYLQKYQEYYKARNDQVERYQKAAQQCEEILKDYITLKQIALRQYCAEAQDNPQLTWDELKNMEGKPIWVEYEGYAPNWEVIEYIGNTKWKWGEVIETHLSILHKETQGKIWKAYRKEKNE